MYCDMYCASSVKLMPVPQAISQLFAILHSRILEVIYKRLRLASIYTPIKPSHSVYKVKTIYIYIYIYIYYTHCYTAHCYTFCIFRSLLTQFEHSLGLGGESLLDVHYLHYALLTARSLSTLVTPQCNPHNV